MRHPLTVPKMSPSQCPLLSVVMLSSSFYFVTGTFLKSQARQWGGIFLISPGFNTKSIIDSLQEVLPYPTRGLKYGQPYLYELKQTKASACLIEILFHDDEKQALYIINNKTAKVYSKTDKGYKLIKIVRLSKKHNQINISKINYAS